MKNLLVILSCFLVLFTSCEKLIDVDQPDIIEQDQAFNDKNSTRLSMLGLYGLMADLVEPMFLAGELRADLTIANKSAETYLKEFSNNSFSASNPYVSAKPFYTLINNVNDFEAEFELQLTEGEMDTATFFRYKGELVAIRVWTQYQIAKIFGSCSYYTDVLSQSQLESVEVLEFEDVLLKQLISDLEFVDTMTFTPINEDLTWQTIRFTDYYVNALMADLLIDVGEYDLAYDKLNELTRSGDGLRKKPADKFSINKGLPNNLWLAALFNREWQFDELLNNAVFMIAFDNKYNQISQLYNWTYNPSNYQIIPSQTFINQFEDNYIVKDEDGNEITDYRYYSITGQSYIGKREYYIRKYRQDDRPYIITRTARVELLKAYCQLHLGKDSKAISFLNKSRKRVDFLKIDKDLVPDDENEALIWLEDKIMDELAYETAFEGERWYDLMRVAKRRNDPSYLANKVIQKYPLEQQAELKEKLMKKQNWFIPIY